MQERITVYLLVAVALLMIYCIVRSTHSNDLYELEKTEA